MKQVMTVCGPVNAKELGFCQCHEHLAISPGVSGEQNPVLVIDDEEKSLQEARRLRAQGGKTVVDAQPGGCNRMERTLQRIAVGSDLNIIASTGFHKRCFYPKEHWLFRMSGKELCSIFLHELTEGMYSGTDSGFWPEDTGIRAGIVKMALDKEGLTPIYRKLFEAGTCAAVRGDVPVMVHIEKGTDPLALFDFLKEQGIAPQRIIFCHMDRAVSKLEVHRKLLEKGIFLEYDTIGRFRYHSDGRELEIFRYMLDAGFEDQLLFSLDTTRARLKAYTPAGVGLDYLLTSFVPAMKKFGITHKQIRKISHDNFARAFTE